MTKLAWPATSRIVDIYTEARTMKSLGLGLSLSGRGASSAYPSIPAAGGSNLFTYSQQFDNAAWTKLNCSITGNSIAAPDGTTTAETHTFGSSPALVYQAPLYANGSTNTVSVWAKAGTGTQLRIAESGSAVDTYFNLSNGTITSQTGGSSYIIDYGNGWYRCVVVWTTAAPGIIYIGSDTAGTRYLWQAQFLSGTYADGGPLAVNP